MAGQNEWGSGDWGNRETKRRWGENCNPVDTRRNFNVYKTSIRHQRRCIDVLKMLKRRRVSTRKYNERLRRLLRRTKIANENKNALTGPANCKKTTRHFAHLSFCAKSRKTNDAKSRNWPKTSFWAIFWQFRGQISPNSKFFRKIGCMQIEGHI